ncbi:MAG: hypothetical protein QOD09_5081 [Bradyrhizobium sp.]|nr:hypothetical protein [Bradyrhizobium sp.]
MRQELTDLAQLNSAMFRQIFSGEPIAKGIFAAQYDKTDPGLDGCEATRGWDLRIDGDFFLVKRVHNFIYVIVGDATGHHAYAGGLKLFVAAALQSIFERFMKKIRPPTGGKVLKKLHQFFFKVGEAALTENPDKPLQTGTDAVVIRISPFAKTVTYASAGLPAFALGPSGLVRYGNFSDPFGISFPTDLHSAVPFQPEEGPIDVRDVRFLAVVTDGFRDLGRISLANPADAGSTERFGEACIARTLVGAAARLKDDPTSQPSDAAKIAASLVAAAKDFRKGYRIPEASDDDRLVVIVDLEAVWQLNQA